MSNQAQRSFAGGEIAPSFYAHTNLQKYAQALRQCRNFFVQRNGGVANRPGTEYIGATKDMTTSGARLIEFVFNEAQTYVLEFGNLYVRFIQSGDYLSPVGAPVWDVTLSYVVGDVVQNAGSYYYNIKAQAPAASSAPGVGTAWQEFWYLMPDATKLEMPSPYAIADLSGLQWAQSTDVVTIVHRNYAPRELQRLGAQKFTLVPLPFGPLIAAPTGLTLTGGAAGADTWYGVAAVSSTDDEESLLASLKIALKVPTTSAPITVAWTPVTGAQEYNIYRSTDGATFGLIAVVGGTPSVYTDTTWTTSTGSIISTTPGVLSVATNQARNPTVTLVAEKASDGKYRVRGNTAITVSGGTSNPTVARSRLYYKRNSDATRVFAFVTTDVTVYGPGGNSVAFDVVIEVPDNGYSTLEFDIVPEVTLATGGTTTTASITGDSVAYTRSQASFADADVLPDYTQGPPTNPTLFATATSYPAVVSRYQQRQFFANTAAQPEMAWGSRTALPRNFSTSTPVTDSDALSWRMTGRKVNEIRHLVDFTTLLEFTSGGVFVVEGDQAGILKPDAINPRKVSAHGSGDLSPVEIGETAVLYVQARGVKVRSLTAGSQGFGGEDLTIFAAHLFEGYSVVDWAYAEEPHSILWCVRSDGVLIGLTYLAEQEIFGWHRHDTKGTVESVCCVPEGDEDAVYCIVKRTISGATKRYVERLATRHVDQVEDVIFMDSCLSYDGTNQSGTTLTFTDIASPTGESTITATASAALFNAGDEGNAIHFTRNGVEMVFEILVRTSTTVATGVFRDGSVVGGVPLSIGTNWGYAALEIAGLSHLEGETVSVLGDGYVDGSPHNPDYPAIVVMGGQITLPAPRVKVHVGLPYLCDLETLDIDTASGRSLKEGALLINEIGMYVESSRGGFFGPRPPDDDTVDPLQRLYELKARAGESYNDPVALRTQEQSIKIQNNWTKHGRVFIRQVDPLPLAVMAVWPSGYLPL